MVSPEKRADLSGWDKKNVTEHNTILKNNKPGSLLLLQTKLWLKESSVQIYISLYTTSLASLKWHEALTTQ